MLFCRLPAGRVWAAGAPPLAGVDSRVALDPLALEPGAEADRSVGEFGHHPPRAWIPVRLAHDVGAVVEDLSADRLMSTAFSTITLRQTPA